MMNAQQVQAQAQLQNLGSATAQAPPPSFDQVSKLFSIPLSEAADSLGVSAGVLKKICQENGLLRWPHRKFLSGKSIEEIKKDAAREKTKELAELAKAARERNEAWTTSAVSASLGSQLQNKNTSSLQEMSKLRGIPQQQLNKTVQSGRPQDMYSSYMAKKPPASLDEFKYGFPSDGLSTASNKWWGNSIDGNDNGRNGGENNQQDTRHSNELVDEGLDLLSSGIGKSGNGTDESNIGRQGTGLLAAVREKAVEEGRKALKLGVYRCYGERRLSRTQRALLLGIFKSSLPSQLRLRV